MNRLTAAIISNENNDIQVMLRQEKKSSKWAFKISLFKNGHLHSDLLTSNADYETGNSAYSAGVDAVKKITDFVAVNPL